MLKKLESVQTKLKVKNIRQLSKQGDLLEVIDKTDTETINACGLNKEGFVVERPKKVNLSIIIYDVEREHKEDDLKEDLIRKNCGDLSDIEVSDIMNEVKFVHNFKLKDQKRVNWIVQLLAKYYLRILNRGIIYMMWRSYRTQEYVNITRCYNCHGYGHIGKVCNSPDQLCVACGSKEHLKNDCPKKGYPECVNCIRAKRKDRKHVVHSKECPELQKQKDLNNNRIHWL